MLDDTSNPEWVEVSNKSYIRACVVLLVPGLSPKTFHIDPHRGSEGKRMRFLCEVEANPLPITSEIFRYLWLPKAPGTNTQLYSPVAAFLNIPLSNAQSQQRHREQSRQKGTSSISPC
jgi:hypothetical protein